MLVVVKTSFFPLRKCQFFKCKLGRAADWNQAIKHMALEDDCCISQNVGRSERNLVKSNSLDFS